VIAAINEQKVPEAYLEDLTAAVNELAEQIPCATPPPQAEEDKRKDKGEDGDD
jgi:hypothetical protein